MVLYCAEIVADPYPEEADAASARALSRDYRPWSAEEVTRLATARQAGMIWRECATMLGRNMASVQLKARSMVGAPNAPDFTAPPIVRAQPKHAKPDITDRLQFPAAPFAVEVPFAAKQTTGKFTTAVFYGDTHVPFDDRKAVKIVQGVIRDAKPDVLVNVGDLVDCWQVSRFDKDPSRLDTLQQNIDAARIHLHEMAQIAPKARRYLLEGNHETRLQRCIMGLQGAQREFGRLRAFQEAMMWPNLLQLDSIGWTFVPEHEQSRTAIVPKIITKHGSIVRKWSGWSAKGEWEKYGRSGVSGHTHRLGWFVHRDHNGNSNWIETGCTCLLDAPYGVDFDWAHGCVVVTWSADTKLQNVEFVSIRDGRAIWRTREYKA